MEFASAVEIASYSVLDLDVNQQSAPQKGWPLKRAIQFYTTTKTSIDTSCTSFSSSSAHQVCFVLCNSNHIAVTSVPWTVFWHLLTIPFIVFCIVQESISKLVKLNFWTLKITWLISCISVLLYNVRSQWAFQVQKKKNLIKFTLTLSTSCKRIIIIILLSLFFISKLFNSIYSI